MPAAAEFYIGLMSGTSVDSIDAALVEFSGDEVRLTAWHDEPIDAPTRAAILSLSAPGDDEIERVGALDRQLGHAFANAAIAVLAKAGMDKRAVRAIGSHGQTIRHRPPSTLHQGQHAFSLQIGDPNTIAEVTGITTVADFRRREVAAGGQGAPLVPRFHQAAFSLPGVNRAIVNIGGMANVTVLQGRQLLAGYDTGPGNALLDGWIDACLGKNFDRDGAWGATGTVSDELLDALIHHPYFDAPPPKSTGREMFNLRWLETILPDHTASVRQPADVQATLVEFTALSIAMALHRCEQPIDEAYLCGGGAHNAHLRSRLARLLQPMPIYATDRLGIPPDWVEAAAFAWLARQCLKGLPGNHPTLTGASGERILGGIYQV